MPVQNQAQARPAVDTKNNTINIRSIKAKSPARNSSQLPTLKSTMLNNNPTDRHAYNYTAGALVSSAEAIQGQPVQTSPKEAGQLKLRIKSSKAFPIDEINAIEDMIQRVRKVRDDQQQAESMNVSHQLDQVDKHYEQVRQMNHDVNIASLHSTFQGGGSQQTYDSTRN